MILSNVEIIKAIKNGYFNIEPLPHADPSQAPFNTSSIDLHLGNEILSPKKDAPVQMDLRKGNIANFLATHSERHIITEQQPYSLKRGEFVLAKTLEKVSFPLLNSDICYAARVEGRSSLAKCGILIHFTAPTIHAGFEGTITLEIINFGINDFLLVPELPICQLIIEEVKGSPADAPNQFKGQSSPAGVI
jgi:dCTP deaminase